MKSRLLNKNRCGFDSRTGGGLVEVLVALAILSMTMITVVSVTTNSLTQIKRDEIKDRAVGIQFRALELAKSPVDNLGLSTLQRGEVAHFRLYSSASGIVLERASGAELISKSNCDSQSDYFVDLEDFGYEAPGNNLICNQVIIELENQQEDIRTYKVSSLLVYNVEGELVFNELVGYRRESSI
ncbi:hypothetical protein GF389_04515 [Candidatus Dojkabacteria bacterium]|nr:hypothetical protein [Candidatus Dojkabacteria bacterium]